LASLPQHPYFSSLAISTLNFLDPSNFASKPREEKASFLKGLLRVLPGFSERLRKRKVLPALLDEVRGSVIGVGKGPALDADEVELNR
jgi:SCY1-like protein 2